MKILQVVEQAFRTLVEEQDDTILWLSQSMLGAGAEMEVLLAGNCACYAVAKQRQPALQLGSWQQTEPAELQRDVANILAKGAPVYVIKEDLAERGLAALPLHDGVTVIERRQLPEIYERADQIWQW